MELGNRQRRILKAVVENYVESAEPVGSETLARKYDFGVKPATIRNELAAMSEMGYLKQPHTSAGRVPSDLGYRIYVDSLIPMPPRLADAETVNAKQCYDPFENELEAIIHRTCRILARITHYTSIATTPRIDNITLKQIALLSVNSGKIVMVIIMSNGVIDHRAIDYHDNIDFGSLMALTNLINERFGKADYIEVSAKSERPLPTEMMHLYALYEKAIAAIKQSFLQAEEDEAFVEGVSNILKQPEFTRSDKVAMIMDILENHQGLSRIMNESFSSPDISVAIGSENILPEMQECSFVASTYSIGDRPCGRIAVIGPTRMNYERAMAAVELMASNLSFMLTSLSIT